MYIYIYIYMYVCISMSYIQCTYMHTHVETVVRQIRLCRALTRVYRMQGCNKAIQGNKRQAITVIICPALGFPSTHHSFSRSWSLCRRSGVLCALFNTLRSVAPGPDPVLENLRGEMQPDSLGCPDAPGFGVYCRPDKKTKNKLDSPTGTVLRSEANTCETFTNG